MTNFSFIFVLYSDFFFFPFVVFFYGSSVSFHFRSLAFAIETEVMLLVTSAVAVKNCNNWISSKSVVFCSRHAKHSHVLYMLYSGGHVIWNTSSDDFMYKIDVFMNFINVPSWKINAIWFENVVTWNTCAILSIK